MTALLVLTHLVLGLVTSFLGALPFGIVNLSVVDVTIKQNFKAGFHISIGASIVEAIQFLLALFLGMFISQNIDANPYVQLFVVALFLVLGLIFFFRKTKEKTTCPKYTVPNFLKGMFLALINPQALPFWVFVIAWFQSSDLVQLDPQGHILLVLWFLIGVWGGKLLALLLFQLLSIAIEKRVKTIHRWMNKIIGGVLLFIAMWQGIGLIL